MLPAQLRADWMVRAAVRSSSLFQTVAAVGVDAVSWNTAATDWVSSSVVAVDRQHA